MTAAKIIVVGGNGDELDKVEVVEDGFDTTQPKGLGQSLLPWSKLNAPLTI